MGLEGGVTKRHTAFALAALTIQIPRPAVAAPAPGVFAGRLPGLTKSPDEEGFYTYTRPPGKSGGHGVGWSEIPRYSFKVPAGWEETPVSIADLGGTEIDLRFSNKDEGEIAVVVAPVLRFKESVGFNADVRIDQIAAPDRIIAGFAPELWGGPLDEGDVIDTQVANNKGLMYYRWDVKPHKLVSATAVGNRVFILTANANSRQWKKAQALLRSVRDSFEVPETKV